MPHQDAPPPLVAGELYDAIDVDGSNDVDQSEWVNYFCRDRQAVREREGGKWDTEWDPTEAGCRAISGFIFDCDGTLYQPSGTIPVRGATRGKRGHQR